VTAASPDANDYEVKAAVGGASVTMDTPTAARTPRPSATPTGSDRPGECRAPRDAGGLRPPQVVSVSGLADRQFGVPDKPLDSRNRRVSILVKGPLLKESASSAPETTPHAIMGGRTD
jgi:hypothetical protein